MKAKEIAFVCYAVKDLKRARKFYEGILNLKPYSKWIGKNMGFIEYEMGPHTLALGQGAPNFKPGKNGGTVALEVENFDKAVKRLKDKKVKFILKPHETSVCFMAMVNDTEGNQVMIHKRKKK